MGIAGLAVALAPGWGVSPANRRSGDPDISYGGGRTPIFFVAFPVAMCRANAARALAAFPSGGMRGRLRRYIRITRHGSREGLTGREPGERLPWSQLAAASGSGGHSVQGTGGIGAGDSLAPAAPASPMNRLLQGGGRGLYCGGHVDQRRIPVDRGLVAGVAARVVDP